ncbi:MAG: glycosyltransferase family 2 protein [Xenococcaceae cyanobacterium]
MNLNNISVVITCYSEGKLIFDAVNSALNQSQLPCEIIIVNDASKDTNTIEACKQLEQYPNIQVIWRSQNGGPSIARNDGFKVAKCEILVPLDADDILPINSLKSISNTFQKYPDAGFVYGYYFRQDRATSKGVIVNPGEISLKSMLQAKRFSLSSNWKLLGTTPLRRSLWESVGEYDSSFGVEDLHDVEFWIRAMASGCSYYPISSVIYTWRKYLGSNSKRVTPLAWYRIAQKYFSIYQQLDLEYRAYELLLLGSKWLDREKESQLYSQKLLHCLSQGKLQLSTLISLGISTKTLRSLTELATQTR